MKRQVLDTGHWFDKDAADFWTESTYWNGRNRVSRATDDQFQHETLFHTTGGKWILTHWSDWQGSKETWSEISTTDAALWLARNLYEPDEACAAEFAALEVK